MAEADLLLAATRCTQCGACRVGCPTFDVDPKEERSGRGRFNLAVATLDGRLHADPFLSRALFSCVHCGFCDQVCPTRVPVTELIRAAAGRLDATRVAESGVLWRAEHLRTSDERNPTSPDGLFSVSAVVWSLCCPDSSERASAQRLVGAAKSLGLDVELQDSSSCGRGGKNAGPEATGASGATSPLTTVLTSCAACRLALASRADTIAADPLEFLVGHWESRGHHLRFESTWAGRAYLVQSSCQDRSRNRRSNWPRYLRTCGLDLRGLKGPFCCGAGWPGLRDEPDQAAALAQAVVAAITKDGVTLLASDPHCARHLKRASPGRPDIEVMTPLELFSHASSAG